MTPVLSHRRRLCPVVMFLMLLVACSTSKPARFYTLNSLAQNTTQDMPTSGRSISVGIGPVTIPDYLDRPQIVTRTNQNELNISEFNRWAGSLDSNVARVLVENLSTLLSPEGISVTQWERAATVDHRIAVDIIRLDAMPDGNVVLKAQWTILGNGENTVLTTRESSFSECIDGESYNARVAAMSRALADLSQEIADAMNAIIQRSNE